MVRLKMQCILGEGRRVEETQKFSMYFFSCFYNLLLWIECFGLYGLRYVAVLSLFVVEITILWVHKFRDCPRSLCKLISDLSLQIPVLYDTLW
jgi:hypothetical protein